MLTGNGKLYGDGRRGSTGDDVFYSHEGWGSRIYCGPGYDVVFADPSDMVHQSEKWGWCERVYRVQ